MLTAFARAFKTPDLRKKLLFTLGIIVVARSVDAIDTFIEALEEIGRDADRSILYGEAVWELAAVDPALHEYAVDPGQGGAILEDHPFRHIRRPQADPVAGGETRRQETSATFGLLEQGAIAPAAIGRLGSGERNEARRRELD